MKLVLASSCTHTHTQQGSAANSHGEQSRGGRYVLGTPRQRCPLTSDARSKGHVLLTFVASVAWSRNRGDVSREPRAPNTSSSSGKSGCTGQHEAVERNTHRSNGQRRGHSHSAPMQGTGEQGYTQHLARGATTAFLSTAGGRQDIDSHTCGAKSALHGGKETVH